MAMLSPTETRTEEILKKEHAEAQADEKGTSKSNINMRQSRCMSKPSLNLFSASPALVFSSWIPIGASVSFSSSLAGFAALYKLRYGEL